MVIGTLLIICSITTTYADEAHQSLSYLEIASRYADLASVAERRLAQGTEPTTTILGPLCLAYGRIKKYDKLFECLKHLEARFALGDSAIKPDYPGFNGAFMRPSDARPLIGLLKADAFLELGEYTKSMEAAQDALKLLGDNPETSMSMIWFPLKYQLSLLSTHALAAGLAGHRETALASIKQLNDVGIPWIGHALTEPMKAIGLARAYMAIGDYDKAVDQIRSIGSNFKLTWALGDATNPTGARGDSLRNMTEVVRLVMLGKALSEMGKTVDAIASLDEVLGISRLKDFGDLHWLTLYERGKLAERGSNVGAAIAFYQQAVDVIEVQRSSIGNEANKIGFAGDKQSVYERLIRLLVLQKRAGEALEYVERSKARALVDMLASKKDFAIGEVDSDKARLILAQLDSADADSRASAVGVQATVVRGGRNLEMIRQEMRQAAPELSTLVTVTSVPPDDLKKLIGQNEALVEYYYQDADLYAFVLHGDRLSVSKLDAKGLSNAVQAFRSELQSFDSTAWQDSSRALYMRLWQPVESGLDVRKVVVVAHGALHYLPFAALQSPDGRLLIDQYSFRFLPSASVLKFLRPSVSGQTGALLSLGNPDLDEPSLNLEFAEDEARTIATIFPQSRLLVRKDASESNFKRAGSVFSRIHFATHGKFQADDPLNSGLYLAKDEGNDGVLTVGELYSMKLDADLVTLSACETGLGKIANGDDVVGLTRGFLYAGTRSIVASLWSVDDRATAELMSTFYKSLAGVSKQEALRAAQLKVRGNFPHPYFWAAFQLTGRAD